MRVSDLNDYLKSLVKIDIPDSVDRIIIGDPKTTVRRIGTCWLPYWNTLKAAKKQGVNVIVTHEPTFYHHFDLDAKDQTYPEEIGAKKRWIIRNKMAIIRYHDALDKVQADFGIPFAWGTCLGFKRSDIIRSETFFNVYRVPKAPAGKVVKRIAKSLLKVRQAGVAFYGDAKRMVKSVCIGTGCYANPRRAAHLKPDLFIAVDDSISTWCEAVFSEDTGYPLVVVNHGTSEEWAMLELRNHLAKQFPDVPVVYFRQGCGYRWISAG